VPRIAFVGFISIQLFTMMGRVFPLEIPTNRPTVDVIPWDLSKISLKESYVRFKNPLSGGAQEPE
ncbi:hypothetical protein Pmar_PMAR000163, partial [Perkinsus marinus ATCC 50983]